MNASNECQGLGPRPLSRRELLKSAAAGFGWAAFAGLATASARAETPSPLSIRAPHLPARAKRVIFLCMQGGPAHQDTFDFKPRLQADSGNAFGGRARGTHLIGSPFRFQQHGQSGLWMSELFPRLGRQADRICMVHSMRTDIPNHPQAFLQLHTGSAQFVRPSMGSWVLYGLGSANQDLPGFVSIGPPAQLGARNYGSAFLPAVYQGTRIGSGREGSSDAGMNHVVNPRLSSAQQRRQLDLIQSMNRDLQSRTAEPAGDIEAVIESGELAFRMQTAVPELLDLSRESEATRELYGVGDESTDSFGRQCLLARRFAEAGSRFIEVNLGGWDQHQNLESALRKNCRALDRPAAALLEDLAARGLLDDTLVLWGGEFGRTPDSRREDGRDHNHQGFTMWVAGGGMKAGLSYGSTDEYGGKAVENPVHIHDLHATLLHALGLDHERLTYRYGGRDYRLTDVHGSVVKALLA
jgi:hypothetical protein